MFASFPIRYVEPVFRPPSEAQSLILPVTEGCSWNKCTFCEAYKGKRFAIKPMDVEEAVLQMELLGHSFYVFENAEDGEVNVLYQRKDGNYGLIEPER